MNASTGPCIPSARPRFAELTLDQLLAEPIVQQLMRRDRVDEAAIRRLVRETGSRSRFASDC
jgi:hypothetical protein